MSYLQTWHHVAHMKKHSPALVRAIQFVCGLFGHEISRTEWGYGGGEKVSVWCRWCNKLIVIPMSEARFRFPIMEELKPEIREVMRNQRRENDV